MESAHSKASHRRAFALALLAIAAIATIACGSGGALRIWFPPPRAPIDNVSAAIPLMLGQSVVGNIEVGGDVHYYRIEPQEGTLFTVRPTGPIDVTLRSYGRHSSNRAQGGSIVGTSVRGSAITAQAEDEVYHLRITAPSLGHTGPYGLHTQILPQEDHSSAPDSATPLMLGQPLIGEFRFNDDTDLFRLEIPMDSAVVISGTGAVIRDGALLGSNGRFTLIEDHNNFDGDDFRIATYMLKGTYFVRLRGSSGPYTLLAEAEQ